MPDEREDVADRHSDVGVGEPDDLSARDKSGNLTLEPSRLFTRNVGAGAFRGAEDRAHQVLAVAFVRAHRLIALLFTNMMPLVGWQQRCCGTSEPVVCGAES